MAFNFPKNVRIISTPRQLEGGFSDVNSGYGNFNLADHVGDELNAVANNRHLLLQHYQLPAAPQYLTQIHSNICLNSTATERTGDAMLTQDKNTVCCVMSADCLPIFASNSQGTQVGVAHAGWQGIVGGIIEEFVAQFQQKTLIIHFGAAISQRNFEVGEDVYQQFCTKNTTLANAFIASGKKYKLDLYQAAKIILNGLGVDNISGGEKCTFAQQNQYFSYRRDGKKSGRMAHLIWLV
jgi:YfiH family protein